MAKIETPSYIKRPGGRMGDAVLYTVGNRVYMRCYVIPRNPRTPLQQENRHLFAEAMVSWKSLTPEVKSSYKKRSMNLNMRAHNLYISEYMRYKKEVVTEVDSNRPDYESTENTMVPHGISSLYLRCSSEASPSREVYGFTDNPFQGLSGFL